jgi:hypothetical protein
MNYVLFIITLSEYKIYFQKHYLYYSQQYNLNYTSFEEAYDWVVREAVKNILAINKVELHSHYRHDIYRCLYSDVGMEATIAINEQFERNNITFHRKDFVKAMVAGDSLIIAKGIRYVGC